MRRQTIEIMCLLAERLPHAHPHRALNLSLHCQRVDRVATIESSPHVIDANRARRLVDCDFNNLSCVAEAHGRSNRSTLVLAALGVRWAGEGPFHLDRAAADKGFFHHLGKRKARLATLAD